MRVSKDPMEPLRCWKELFLGERAFRTKKSSRFHRRRHSHATMLGNSSHVVVGE